MLILLPWGSKDRGILCMLRRRMIMFIHKYDVMPCTIISIIIPSYLHTYMHTYVPTESSIPTPDTSEPEFYTLTTHDGQFGSDPIALHVCR